MCPPDPTFCWGVVSWCANGAVHPPCLHGCHWESWTLHLYWGVVCLHVCGLVCKLWLSVQVAAICLSLPSYTPSLSLSPVQSPSTLFTSVFYHTLGLSHIHYTALSSQQTPSPLHPLTHLHTTLPLLLSAHHLFLSLSLYLFPYTTFPFPLLFPTVESVLHFSPAKWWSSKWHIGGTSAPDCTCPQRGEKVSCDHCHASATFIWRWALHFLCMQVLYSIPDVMTCSFLLHTHKQENGKDNLYWLWV